LTLRFKKEINHPSLFYPMAIQGITGPSPGITRFYPR
jgi:hypothetical protein